MKCHHDDIEELEDHTLICRDCGAIVGTAESYADLQASIEEDRIIQDG